METLLLKTPQEGFLDITDKISEIIRQEAFTSGIC